MVKMLTVQVKSVSKISNSQIFLLEKKKKKKKKKKHTHTFFSAKLISVFVIFNDQNFNDT